MTNRGGRLAPRRRHAARLAQRDLPAVLSARIDHNPTERRRPLRRRILDLACAGRDRGRCAINVNGDILLGRRLDRLLARQEQRDALGFEVGAARIVSRNASTSWVADAAVAGARGAAWANATGGATRKPVRSARRDGAMAG